MQEIPSKAAIALDAFKKGAEFSIEKVKTISKNSFYSCCPEAYPTIVFEFTVQRQYSTYITSIIIPLIFATFVAFTTLLMPAPLSGARPGLNVSIMFTCAAIYFVAGNKLPDISDMTLIARLYVACLSVNFILTLTSVLSTG